MIPGQFKPRLAIDAQTQLALQELAKPYLGKVKLKRLVEAVESMLADRFPEADIIVVDFTMPNDRAIPMIKLGILLGGEPDQGLVFGHRKADGSIYGTAANDR